MRDIKAGDVAAKVDWSPIVISKNHPLKLVSGCIRTFQQANRNVVTGNVCEGNTLNGINLDGADYNTISGNVSNGNGNHGIFLDGCDSNVVVGNICTTNDVENTGSFDGICIEGGALGHSERNLIIGNHCIFNDRWGLMLDEYCDFHKIAKNYTNGNTAGSIRINNANDNNNQIEFNTVEEGAPGNAGTASRIYGNYDPSADAFVGDVGVAPF